MAAALDSLIFRYIDQGEQMGRFRGDTGRTKTSILLGFSETVDVDPPKLNRAHIQRWVKTQNVGASTLHNKFGTVRAFCNWLRAEDILRSDPFRELAGPKKPITVPRGLQLEQVQKLFVNLPDSRAELICSLMAQEGLRCCEVARLCVGGLDLQKKLLVVSGKGSKERILPLMEETEMYLRRYLSEYPARSGPLVRSYQNTHRALTPGRVSTLVSNWMADAGIKDHAYDGTAAHALRHTAATDMLENGANIRQVQVFLGHSSLAVTERYLGWDIKGLREAASGRRYRP